MGPIEIIATSIGGIVVLFTLLYLLQFVGLYVQAWVSGAKVGFLDLVMMRFRKVKPRIIVENRITAKKAGLDIPTAVLEAHFLAGGAGHQCRPLDDCCRQGAHRTALGNIGRH